MTTPAPSTASVNCGLAPFAHVADLGPAPTPGQAAYDLVQQEFSLRSSAALGGAGDTGLLLWRRLRGGCILQARTALTAGSSAGLVVRAGLDPFGPAVAVIRQAGGATAIRVRRTPGGAVEEICIAEASADMLQLEQRGDEVVVAVAKFGDLFTRHVCRGIAFGAEVVFGLMAGDGEARFHNVRLVRPAPAGFRPYHDYIGSELELIDAVTGRRTILHHEDDSLQAPNWTPDGAALICNRNGRLWRYDLTAHTITLLDTGDQVRNNNDHAISFDGKMLGISSGEVSRVYTVPIGGGQPKLLTHEGQ